MVYEDRVRIYRGEKYRKQQGSRSRGRGEEVKDREGKERGKLLVGGVHEKNENIQG